MLLLTKIKMVWALGRAIMKNTTVEPYYTHKQARELGLVTGTYSVLLEDYSEGFGTDVLVRDPNGKKYRIELDMTGEKIRVISKTAV